MGLDPVRASGDGLRPFLVKGITQLIDTPVSG